MKELILSTRDVWPEAGSEVRRWQEHAGLHPFKCWLVMINVSQNCIPGLGTWENPSHAYVAVVQRRQVFTGKKYGSFLII